METASLIAVARTCSGLAHASPALADQGTALPVSDMAIVAAVRDVRPFSSSSSSAAVPHPPRPYEGAQLLQSPGDEGRRVSRRTRAPRVPFEVIGGAPGIAAAVIAGTMGFALAEASTCGLQRRSCGGLVGSLTALGSAIVLVPVGVATGSRATRCDGHFLAATAGAVAGAVVGAILGALAWDRAREPLSFRVIALPLLLVGAVLGYEFDSSTPPTPTERLFTALLR